MSAASMQLVYDVAISLLNVPYVWGGKSPNAGLDCSGTVNWILHAFHLDIPGAGAIALYEHFSLPENHISQAPQLGALVFYGTPVDHVVMCVSDKRVIGAQGGDHTITSKELAAARGACVRVAPLYEKNRRGIFMPAYEEFQTP